MEQPTNGNGGKIKSVIFNEFSLIIAICAAVLSAFIFLTSPQQKSDVAIELLKAQVQAQNGTIDIITKTQQNDTQEVKGNVASLTTQIQNLSINVTRLETVINERIPKK